ncbi:MAG: myosin tail [Olpidium bornovanus]|uniref:Myosin tail n=1 Tax=Olpidium bornovanus TaxID=278681 RepID=A0A8H7ZSY2_9FUNG|nr:MAG: myosin tail [Olpidium bornovanus]
MNEGIHEANRSRQAALRNFDAKDQECVELRSLLEEQMDISSALQDKLRKAEMTATDSAAELQKHRDVASELERSKVRPLALERQNKELQLRIVDLEAGAAADTQKSSRRLESRLEDLASQLDSEARDKNDAIRNARKTERTIRELQYTLAERDKARARYEEEMTKILERTNKMKQQIEELELAESNLQLQKRRAEREALESRERALRSEREVERLKARLEHSVQT